MTMAQPELSIIVPNFNDAESVLPFLSEIIAVLEGRPDYSYEIIVVDDGSRDESVPRLRELVHAHPQIMLAELSRNFGQQIALYVGLTCAKGSILVTIDGDGQYPADTIVMLADAIREGYDMASGNRASRRDSIWTKTTSRIGAFLIRKSLNMDITDFGSVKAFSRSLVDRIVSVQVGHPDVYPAALARHPRLKELEIPHRDRMHGISKWSLTRRIKLYFDLYIKYSEDQFGIIFKTGLMLMVLSAAGTFALLLYKAILGHQESVLLILALGAIFFAVGLQFILWTFVASALKQIMRRDTFESSELIRDIYVTHETEPAAEGVGHG